jgi:hypothetical protein
LEEETLYGLFVGLDISMDETPAALEGIELFHEWSDNSADRVGSVDPAGESHNRWERVAALSTAARVGSGVG